MAKSRQRKESVSPASQGAPAAEEDSRTTKPERKSGEAGVPKVISSEEIARLAYDLWEKDGRVHGNDQRHWLEAERILRDTRKN